MHDREAVVRFHDSLRALQRPQPGCRAAIDVAGVRRAIAADPEIAVAYVEVFCESGPIQMAAIVAAAYNVEFGDDTLIRRMHQAAAHNPATAAALAGLDLQLSPARKPLVLGFNLDQLVAGDVTRLANLFAQDQMTPEKARAARGRLVLALPLDDDPRPPETVPEVRRLVRNLAALVPHFAYFLSPQPEQGMTLLWFGCLAPVESHGPKGFLLSSQPVLDAIFPSLDAVRDYCSFSGEDPGTVLAEVLAFCPEGFREELIAAVLQRGQP